MEITTVPRELYYHEVAYVRGLEAENERLRADKDVRRSQERNTSYEKDIAELEAENNRLRTELAYIVSYFQGGIRPTDLNDWWRRACEAIALALEPRRRKAG